MGLKSGGSFPKLTKTEKAILRLLKRGGETASSIALHRKTSTQAVYKIFKSLEKKGYFSKIKKPTVKPLCTLKSLNQKNKSWRVHGLELNAKVLYFSSQYKKKIKGSLKIDGNLILIYSKSIKIYSEEGLSFWGSSVSESIQKALFYFERIIYKLESDLNIIIRKDRFQNVKISKCHISNTNNTISKKYNNPPLKVKCTTDLKLWLITDNSYNLWELEFIHPETFLEDSEKMEEWLTDFRDTELLTNRDIRELIGETLKNQIKNTKQISELTKQQEIFVLSLKAISQTLNNHIDSSRLVAKSVSDLMTLVSRLVNSNNDKETTESLGPAPYIG